MEVRLNRLMHAAAAVCLTTIFALSAIAQNYSTDAREIGMGGADDQKNIAVEFAGKPRAYRSIGLPIGLIQVLKHPDVFDPAGDNFNPLRAMEYAANPLHFVFTRDSDQAGEALVKALVNGNVSRDLNTYRGFVPASNVSSDGLLAPNWGKTLRVYNSGDGLVQGVYVGAGPYIAIGTNFDMDRNLIDLLASSTNTYKPNSNFAMHDTTGVQSAAAITAGYRARFPVLGRSKQNGLYFGVNYNYLRGFHYDADNFNVRFDTDQAGLVTLLPTTTPLAVNRVSSSSGRGMAVDLGTDLVVGRWDVRFGANGIRNYIDWDDLSADAYTLSSLSQGLSFTHTQLPAPAGTRRVELPVRYSGGGGYHTDRWTLDGEMARGLQGREFHGGGEYRLGRIELRGGSRYARQMWHPAWGVGLNFTEKFAVDAAMFTSAANVESERKVSMALSLRITK